MLGPPRPLLRRNQPPEVPRRSRIARGLRHRQQPLRRAPPPRRVHPRPHHLGHGVVVTFPRLALRTLTVGVLPLDHPLHRLRCGAAHGGGPAVAPHLVRDARARKPDSADDLGVYAAWWYSLMRPPRTGEPRCVRENAPVGGS